MGMCRYVYHELNYKPTDEDKALSETRESHLREGLVRMRELLHMTGHELVRFHSISLMIQYFPLNRENKEAYQYL